MIKTFFPFDEKIYIEINGTKLAAVEEYKVCSNRKSRYVESMGNPECVRIVPGKVRHSIELGRVYICEDVLGDGIDIYRLHNFNLVVIKKERRVIYSGCEWQEIVEKSALEDRVIESAKIVAAKRMEVLNH